MVRRIAKVSDIEGTLHVDAYLTNMSESFMQEAVNFISNVAATNIPVLKASDKFVKYPRGYFWRDEAEVRPLGGRPPQVGYKIGSDNYNAEEWALEHTVDDRQRANTDAPIRLDVNAVNLLTQKQMIRADRLWSALVWTTGVWIQDFTPTLPWDNANSIPIKDVDTQKEFMFQNTGFMPNTLILGANVKKELRSHPDLVDRIKYTQTGILDDQLLARLFDVQNVRVARSIYNAANETDGATGGEDFHYIVDPDSAWLGYIAPSAGLDTPTAIARFAWTGLIPGAANQFGGVITRGRDDRAYTDWFHSRTAFGFKIVSEELGMFFPNLTGALSQ